jgi:hypothetical protein
VQRRAALVLARWAREKVSLYRDLYVDAPPVETWADFQRLPVLTTARLRATPLAAQVDTLDDVLRSATAYVLQSVVTPRTLVLDDDDAGAAFDQTRAGFALAGIRRGARVMLVTPPWQRYLAAEIADQLGYFGVEAHLVIVHTPETLARTLAALAPVTTVTFGVPLPPGAGGWITVRNPESTGTDLYIVPEAGIAAVRPAGEAAYRVLTRYCLLEAHAGGRLLLTALRRYHQPLIRYELPDRGRMERGRLWLTEVAP